jgi:hypothetical protein
MAAHPQSATQIPLPPPPDTQPLEHFQRPKPPATDSNSEACVFLPRSVAETVAVFQKGLSKCSSLYGVLDVAAAHELISS